MIADTFDRKKLLLAVTVAQLLAAAALAWVVTSDDPSKVAIVAAVLVGGIGGAIFMPAYSAVLPYLVGRDDLPGAISLQSAQMNLSRVDRPGHRRRDLRRLRALVGLPRQRRRATSS